MTEQSPRDWPELSKLNDRLRKDISDTLAESEEILRILSFTKGLSGAWQTMVLTPDRVIIGKVGPMAGVTFGSMVTSFYCREILSIEFNKRLLGSWIEILTPAFQGNRSAGFSMKDRSDNPNKRPNCFLVNNSEVVTQMIQAIRDQMTASRETQPLSSAQQEDMSARLEKLADLFSKGMLTEDEFKLAKAKLLET